MLRAPRPLVALCAALALALPAEAEEPARRVVSINPSLSQILVAIGARDTLVGVDEVSRQIDPSLAALPSVGGLFDPSLEAVVGLEPDLVVLVPSVEQRDFHDRLVDLGLRTVAFRNIRFDEVLSNIADLGRLVGREEDASRRIAAIRATREAVAAAARERQAVGCLVVLQRDPVFVAARGSFLDEMLASAGCINLGRQLGEGYPRASLEWIVASEPQVILDMSFDAASRGGEDDYWQSWPTLPAVRDGRVLHIDATLVTMPGPDLDRALRTLARALHGPAIDAEIDARLAPAKAGQP